MNILKQWAVTIVISAVFGAVIQILTPKGKVERAVKTTLSLFFLCALISPMLTGELSVDSKNFDNLFTSPSAEISERQNNLNQTVLNQVKYQTENTISQMAYELGIEEINTEVFTDISEENGIVINKINISVPARYRNKAAELLPAVKKAFGVTPALDVF